MTASVRATRRHTARRINHDSYDDTYIRGILNTVKTIAMVGISAKDHPAELFRLQISARARLPHDPGQSRARRPANCSARKSMRRLADIPEPVDMVDIFRAADMRAGVVAARRSRLTPRPQVIWMQLGVRNDEAARLAEDERASRW